jgi:hypothetical protein
VPQRSKITGREAVTMFQPRVGGQTKAATAKLLNTSPLLTFDGVDKMYCQLAKIHAIAVVQLAECARWRQSNPATSPIWAGPVGRDPS